MDKASTIIQLRASEADRALIDRAAEIAGTNRTQFMLKAALKDAKDTILDHQSPLLVDADAFAAVIDQLNDPTPVSASLRKTLDAKSPWARD